MAVFQITYDLMKYKNYDRIIAAIKANFPTWAKPLESTFLVSTNSTAAAIRDLLRPYIDNDDKLVVASVDAMAWTTTIPKDVAEWIKDQYRRNAA